ncbi:hypothetical protein B0A55_09787, partial [Friedmanniomyces simplex]
MSRKEQRLTVVDPLPIADEQTPLLTNQHNGATPVAEHHDIPPEAASLDAQLEAQASQERREHDAGAVPVADEPTTGKLLMTMGSLWLSTIFAALDSTIVATLSGPISADFKSGTLFSWIASGYLIANAACQPLSGKLTDIYGRRAGLAFASIFFAAGTFICGIATSGWFIIFGRVIAGMGGGCLNTISTFVGSDLVPLRKRGVWQGISNIVYGAGMGLGGVFGGAINDRLGWRWAFYIQVPFITVAGIAGFLTVKVPIKETETANIRRVDFLGALTLVASLILCLVGLNSGGNI